MKLSVGIIGLPNAGKSTLFNAILEKNIAETESYPFCTIDPNVGVVEVPDERIPVLAKIAKSKKIIYPTIEFIDIAGLVKGASKGEGLGNKFLSHIRETNAIAHVIRVFSDSNVQHTQGNINPKRDIEIVELELILKDIQTLEKQKPPKSKFDKKEKVFFEGVKRLRDILNEGIPLYRAELEEKEKEVANFLNLLTIKPVVFVLNVDEEQLSQGEKIYYLFKDSPVTKENSVIINAKLEDELIDYPRSERRKFLKEFNVQNLGLDKLIKRSYEILGLISFLTAGEKEARGWTIKKGTNARKAAGIIHSDFEKHFIKANVIPYSKFVEAGGWNEAKERGWIEIVGEDYILKDGEVVEFKIGK